MQGQPSVRSPTHTNFRRRPSAKPQGPSVPKGSTRGPPDLQPAPYAICRTNHGSPKRNDFIFPACRDGKQLPTVVGNIPTGLHQGPTNLAALPWLGRSAAFCPQLFISLTQQLETIKKNKQTTRKTNQTHEANQSHDERIKLKTKTKEIKEREKEDRLKRVWTRQVKELKSGWREKSEG